MNMVELHAQMIAVLLESGMSLLRITCFSDDVGSKGCSFMCRAGTDCVAYKRDSLTELSFDIHVSSWQITMGRVFDNAYYPNPNPNGHVSCIPYFVPAAGVFSIHPGPHRSSNRAKIDILLCLVLTSDKTASQLIL